MCRISVASSVAITIFSPRAGDRPQAPGSRHRRCQRSWKIGRPVRVRQRTSGRRHARQQDTSTPASLRRRAAWLTFRTPAATRELPADDGPGARTRRGTASVRCSFRRSRRSPQPWRLSLAVNFVILPSGHDRRCAFVDHVLEPVGAVPIRKDDEEAVIVFDGDDRRIKGPT